MQNTITMTTEQNKAVDGLKIADVDDRFSGYGDWHL